MTEDQRNRLRVPKLIMKSPQGAEQHEPHYSPHTVSFEHDVRSDDSSSRGPSPMNQGRRPSIVSTAYSRRSSVSSNVPRQQRSFSITSNDITLPIPQKSPEDNISPRLPSALTSFKKPSPSTSGQDAYPYHLNITPEPVNYTFYLFLNI
jgi:hypothetical protein